MRGLLQSVLRSQVFQGFRSEVMTFQKEKTLPFVGYFLLLAKSLENSLYMNTLNQSLRRFLKADTRFLKKDIYCRYISHVSVQEKVDYTLYHA